MRARRHHCYRAPLTLAWAWALAAAATAEVVVLSADNFTAAVDAPDARLLIEFYAPWCGHCMKLAPEYAEAAKLVAAEAHKDATVVARLAKVDATLHTALADAHGVTNYPTLKWYHRGKASEYTGGRTAAEIAEWVLRRGGEPLKTLADDAAVAAFVLSAPVSAIAYLPASIEAFTPRVVETLTALAESAPDVPMGRAHEAGPPRFVLSRAFDEPNVTYDGALTDLEAMRRFVAAYSLPLVIEFSAATQHQIFGAAHPLHAALLHAPATGADADEMVAFRAAAARLRGEAVCVTMDVERHPEVLEFFDVAAAALPALVVLDKAANLRYPMGAPPTDAAAVEGHVRAVLAGAARPSLRSQPVPEGKARHDEDGVRVVVGATYEETVLGAPAPVALMVYAPWCSHSKRLAPQWGALHRWYKKDARLLVAKLDASANEFRHPEVLSFPRVFFFPANATRLEAAVEMTEPAKPDVEQLAAWVEQMRERHSEPETGAGADEESKDEL